LSNYHEQVKREGIKRLRSILAELPPFTEDFFLGISERTAIRTRLGYALDLKIFFSFLTQEGRKLEGMEIKKIRALDLAEVNANDIRRYLEYVTYYTRNISTPTNREVSIEAYNEEQGKARKLSAVRRLFEFLYKGGLLAANPAELVDSPKIHRKNITYLQADEVAKLLDEVETGAQLKSRQAVAYHAVNRLRDVAIITMFLGTGMRVSELVGINVEHIDFNTNAIVVVRKGGNQDAIFFGDEVRVALEAYIPKREGICAAQGHEGALFLSTQRKRIGVRAVQNLVKKYAKIVTPLKNITPHKLRSTYGTALYNETGDIYLVAEVLGHADVNTTRRHYASMPMERRRKAADIVKLRE